MKKLISIANGTVTKNRKADQLCTYKEIMSTQSITKKAFHRSMMPFMTKYHIFSILLEINILLNGNIIV